MRRTISALFLVLASATGAGAQTAPAGELTFAFHVTLAPSWFDPSTAPPQITPYGILYALHDGLVRPLPGQKIGASLAESWKESPDGLTYEFRMRRGLTFHNGDPVTLEDVKFTFERYKGAGAKELQTRVRQVEIVDAQTLRFHLKEPWPDFLTFYGTPASGAGLVVPKKYLERVGDDGFRKHPIGAGPYKFVSHRPGVEIVLEAFTSHWRKVPHVKRLVMKSVPETTSRVAMLKGGEADVGMAIDGEDALNVKRDPRLQLVPSVSSKIRDIPRFSSRRLGAFGPLGSEGTTVRSQSKRLTASCGSGSAATQITIGWLANTPFDASVRRHSAQRSRDSQPSLRPSPSRSDESMGEGTTRE